MDSRLKDKVAIVTGGGRGIGAAFCEALASAGAKVVIADVLDGTPVVERIESMQGKAIYCRADVTSKQSIEAMVAETERKFGGADILVNNAGLFADLPKKPFQEIGNAHAIAFRPHDKEKFDGPVPPDRFCHLTPARAMAASGSHRSNRADRDSPHAIVAER
jgi:NAD(P)-dependent dehydrogenase (short-subunit alcohol dehydrogenase family)